MEGRPHVQHYLELARLHRRLLIGVPLAAAALAFAVSLYLLLSAPVFTASTKVTVKPSDAELSFSRRFVRSSSSDAANVVTQTHIEYLTSREIASRVAGRLDAKFGAEAAAKPPSGGLIGALRAIKGTVKRGLRVINSGRFVEVPPEEKRIAAIRKAIRIDIVESSYIMKIEARWDDPEIAAEIANVVAQEYRRRASEEAVDQVGTMSSYLEQHRREAEAGLADLRQQEADLRRKLGIVDLPAQRAALLARRDGTEVKLQDDLIELSASRVKVAALSQNDTGLRRSGLSPEMQLELSMSELATLELERRIADREQTLAATEAALTQLSGKEAPLVRIADRIAQAEEKINDISQRLLTLDLARSEGLDAIRIVDPARPALYPDSPKVLVNTMAAAIAGLMLALMAVLLRDATSRSAATRADLGEVPGTRSLPALRPSDVALTRRRLGGPERPDHLSPGRMVAGLGEGLGERLSDRRLGSSFAARRWPSLRGHLGALRLRALRDHVLAPLAGLKPDPEGGARVVIDYSSDRRAALAGRILEQLAPSRGRTFLGSFIDDRLWSRLPRQAGEVIVTLGRDEITIDELSEVVGVVARRLGAPVFLVFVDG